MNQVLRQEYPRPQFERSEWINLNGKWSFRFDPEKNGVIQGWHESKGFGSTIIVPFAPESRLSGVGHTDFIEMMWYHHTLKFPGEWASRKILLHFGGVDYHCIVYLDGREVGVHAGGSAPFTVELTGKISCDVEHDLVLRVTDEPCSGKQAFGKQSPWKNSRLCSYTRTTGIWRTVWAEAVARNGLAGCRVTPDFDAGALVFAPTFYMAQRHCILRTTVSADGETVATDRRICASGIPFAVTLKNPRAWSPKSPFLYDILYEVINENGTVVDAVKSYAGLRKIHLEENRCYLNNEPIFLRFVLDQGFYPEGGWTAPSDEALRHDIELSMRAGFNGARLHQKVFDERFHYWADRLGYLTWAEFPDWGIGFWQFFREAPLDYDSSIRDFFAEWNTILERDFNHPSIIGWTLFNETEKWADWREHQRILHDVYAMTRRLDPTRPINDASGWAHVQTDLWTVHLYDHKREKLQENLGRQPVFCKYPKLEMEAYHGQPYIIDECGGVSFIPEGKQVYSAASWSYGEFAMTQGKALAIITEIIETLVGTPAVSGYCYTQLTDIEQEENGIYYYDRSEKFDMNALHRIFALKPEWSRC